jgi:hypothetical protein
MHGRIVDLQTGAVDASCPDEDASGFGFPMKRARTVSLPGPVKTAFSTGTVGLFITGSVWWWMNRYVRTEGLFGPEHSAAEVWMLKLHGAFAMLFLVAWGAVLVRHVPEAWNTHRNRASGVALISLAAILALTGWGLYYLGDETARKAASRVHLVAGFILPATLLLHLFPPGKK